MKIIKLDTINSTNSFLKEMVQNDDLENFTVVSAKHQTQGKGQMDKTWTTESGKNLTFSFLLKEKLLVINQKYINLAVSLGIYDFLKKIEVPNLSIKWPNDIMAGHEKISGILIEPIIRGKFVRKAIIGIGLNVNQQKFSKELYKATSVSLQTKKRYDLDEILIDLMNTIKDKLLLVEKKEFSILEKEYEDVLFLKNVTTQFRDHNHRVFTGEIIGIATTGNLMIRDENNEILEYGIKEIRFA